MIFVIEGPDGAGKSTLMQAIRADKRTNCHFLSSSAQPRTTAHIRDEVNWLHSLPNTMNLFCDRYRLISEPIYGKALRNADLSKDVILSKMQFTVYIYCRPPREVIKENVENLRQLSGVLEHIDRIIDDYDTMFQVMEIKCPVMRFDYTREETSHFINKLFMRWVRE